MPKRTRYDNVTINAGQVQIYASGITYTFDFIKNWKSYELTNTLNPEEVDYMLNVFFPSGDQMILCKDESELLTIIDELIQQGI